MHNSINVVRVASQIVRSKTHFTFFIRLRCSFCVRIFPLSVYLLQNIKSIIIRVIRMENAYIQLHKYKDPVFILSVTHYNILCRIVSKSSQIIIITTCITKRWIEIISLCRMFATVGPCSTQTQKPTISMFERGMRAKDERAREFRCSSNINTKTHTEHETDFLIRMRVAHIYIIPNRITKGNRNESI